VDCDDSAKKYTNVVSQCTLASELEKVDMEKTSPDIILNELEHIKADISELKSEVKSLQARVLILSTTIAVLNEQFLPVKRVVYGMVAIILTSTLGTLLLFAIRMRGK